MSDRTTATRALSEIHVTDVRGERQSVGRYRKLVDDGEDVTHKMAMTNYAFTADDENCHGPELEIPSDVPTREPIPHNPIQAAKNPKETDTTKDSSDDQVTNDTNDDPATRNTNDDPETKDTNENQASKDTNVNQATKNLNENQATKETTESPTTECLNESETTTVPSENEASRQRTEQRATISDDSRIASADLSNSTNAESSGGIQPFSAKDWRKALCQVDTNTVFNSSNRIYTIETIEAPSVGLPSMSRPNGGSPHHRDALISPSSRTVKYPSRLGSFGSIAVVNRILDVRLRNCSDSRWRRIQTAILKCPVGTT